MQQRHEDISLTERQRIAQSVLSVPNLLRNPGDLPEEPIPFLAAPRSNGLKMSKMPIHLASCPEDTKPLLKEARLVES